MPMKRSFLVPVTLLSACAAPQPTPAPPREAAELVGRTAGPAQNCIPITRTEALRVADGDGHILLYGRGRTIWATNLGAGCGFSPNDVLITQTFSGRYCRGDIVRSTDGISNIPGQSCALGDFVPYTR